MGFGLRLPNISLKTPKGMVRLFNTTTAQGVRIVGNRNGVLVLRCNKSHIGHALRIGKQYAMENPRNVQKLRLELI